MGAYQEILGDLHNLFGDTHAVHVDLDEAGEIVLETVIEGDSIGEVLEYVCFKRADLLASIEHLVAGAVGQQRLSPQEGKRFLEQYRQALEDYTYLENGARGM